MIYHKIQACIRKLLPHFIAERIRSVATGVLTPLYFTAHTGHFKSSLRARAVDREGNAIPWYTYPMIDLLKCKDFSSRTVLEFGAGQSTLWWAKRARKVTSVESDRIWFEIVTRSAPSNAEIHHLADDLTDFDGLVHNQKYDVIVVDGLDRARAAEKAVSLVNTDGFIIVDNSEGYWGPEGAYPIMDMFRERAFSRVDFYGHAPGVILPHCTSVFFKVECFLFAGGENPVRVAANS